MKTQKLIAEYTAKIVVLEEEIKDAYNAIGDFRIGKQSLQYFDIEEAKTKAQIAIARKQDYTQFIKDLEDVD